MDRNFETELPEGYSAVMTIDAENKKLICCFNIAAGLVMITGVALCVMIYRPSPDELFTWKYYAALGMMLAYIVLHELTHGAAYKILTGRKLTFGVKLTVAYCGVPDIFVYRKAALISLLAPFTVFGIVFLLGALLLPLPIDRFLSACLFATHISGCVGDIYDSWLLLTKFREPSILVQDTGPKQTFYGRLQ